MLSSMRAFARSPWAIGLFALLVIALGLTFNDAFSGIQGGGFVKAGSHEVTARDVSRDLQRYINQQRTENNVNLTQQQAAEQGVPQQLLAQRSQQALLLAYADKMGIRASAKSASDVIANSPRFKDALGQTSIAEVARFASDQGFADVAQFEAEFRNTMTQGYLEDSLRSGVVAPGILTRPLMAYLGEQRSVTVASLSPASLPAFVEPTEEQLAAFYAEKGEVLRLPELRQVTVLSYSADDFTDKVSFTDEEIAKEYEARKREFSSPETRAIAEFVSADRNAVQTVVDKVAQAVKLEDAVAQTPGVTLNRRTLLRADIADKQYGDTVFALPANQAFGPIPVDAVFHGVVVETITPGVAAPLAQVADSLRDGLALEAARRLYDRSDETFYEMVQDGATLEAIAAEIGAPVISYTGIDAQGRMPVVRQTTALSASPAVLDSAFSLAAGRIGDVVEFEVDNPATPDPEDKRQVRAVVRVDAVEPPRQPALAEVRNEVRAFYRDEKQREEAGKAVDAVLAAIGAGATMEAAAERARMNLVKPPQPLSRASQEAIDPAVMEGIFKAEAGKPLRIDDSNGIPLLVRVDVVAPVSPEMEASLGAQIQQSLQQSLTFDVQEAFLKSLQEQVKVRRNEPAIQRYLDSFKGEAQ